MTTAPPLPARIASPISEYLERLHAKYAGLDDGEIATYIPELADADPSSFGICLATVDGTVYEVGDTGVEFTLQSISKPLTYGLILDDLGSDAVRARIGVEPTGEAFNAITLDEETGTPANPMVNAGAIAATGMVGGEGKLARLLEEYSRYTDRQLSVDDEVYTSERDTGHRNRAIAHLLKGSGVLDGDPEVALDLYFQQCSVAVTCHDLALISATLANGGLNPVTGERAASGPTTRRVLTVMASCGMYDAAGEWLYTVGLPAKSGVSGGILAVLPGKFGIAVFSPLLDPHGNSVRGVKVCQDLAQELGLRLIEPGGGQPPIRASHSIAEIGSKRVRSAAEYAAIGDLGTDSVAVELQGELEFAEAERVVRHLVALPPGHLAVLDFGRVARVDAATVPFFARLHYDFAARGGRLVFSGLGRHSAFLDELVPAAGALDPEPELLTFDELDGALEWCEARLLESGGALDDDGAVALREHDLLLGLGDEDFSAVEAILERREFAAGSAVLRAGGEADEIYLITRGLLSVMGTHADGRPRRLATLSPGMVLGELAFATGRPRDSTVWADSAVECYALSAADLSDLARRRPTAEAGILRNLVGITSERASQMRSELALTTD